MKKRILSMLLAIVMVVGLVPGFAITASAAESYSYPTSKPTTTWTGNGTESDPYVITTAQQLADFAWFVNNKNSSYYSKYYKLGNDIDISGGTWEPIGYYDGSNASQYASFKGTFDGNVKTISGLNSVSTTHKSAALFGYLENGTIKNLTVSGTYSSTATRSAGICARSTGSFYNCTNNVNITISISSGSAYAGGIAAYCTGNIENCQNNGNLNTIGEIYTGGICGSFGAAQKQIANCTNTGAIQGNGTNGTGGICATLNNSAALISNCMNSGNVSSKSYVGGIIGRANGKVEGCTNSGNVMASTESAGGVCGYNTTSSKSNGGIVNCSNSGTISGPKNIGGISGYGESLISKCYNTGTVKSTNTGSSAQVYVGGIEGLSYGASINNCYNTGAVSGGSSTSQYVSGISGCLKSSAKVSNCFNSGTISNASSSYGKAIAYKSSGTITNCYFLSDKGTDSNATSKSSTEFSDGSVTRLLQAENLELVWGQTIGTDTHPVFYNGSNALGVDATGIVVDPTTVTVGVGKTVTLTATVTPENANDKTVTWASNNDAVATVVNGVVTGVSKGTATITVTSADGGFTATCAVTVCDHIGSTHTEYTTANCQHTYTCTECNLTLTDACTFDAATGICSVCKEYVAVVSVTVNESTTHYKDIISAVEYITNLAGSDAVEMKLTADSTSNDIIYFPAKTITLDLNGKSATIRCLYYVSDADLTIKDSTSEQAGKLLITYQHSITEGAKLTLNSGFVEGNYQCNYVEGTFVMTGGTLKSTLNAVQVEDANSEIIISGGTLDGGQYAIYRQGSYHTSKITLSGGYFIKGIRSTSLSGYPLSGLLAEGYKFVDDDNNNVDATVDYLQENLRVVFDHKHEWTYTANGNTITATCANTDGACGNPEQSIIIEAPYSGRGGLVFDNAVKSATISGTIEDVVLPEIVYTLKSTGEVATPIAPGVYVASLTLGTATARCEFEITKATLSYSSFTYSAPANLTYDGTPKVATVVPNASVADYIGTVEVLYNGSTAPAVDVGSYTVTINVAESDYYKAATNLSLGRRGGKSFSIVAKDIGDLTYTGLAESYPVGATPDVTIQYNGMTLVKDTDYTIEYANNTTPGGTATMTVKGIGNYIGTKTLEFQISEHSHSWSYRVNAEKDTITAFCIANGCTDTNGGSVTIAAPASLDYTGEAIEAGVTNNLVDTTVDVNVVYTAASGSELTEGKPVKVGTYTASITLGDVTAEVTFEIEPAPVVTGIDFNRTSSAYDAATNTFYVSDDFPFELTVTGEYLTMLQNAGGLEAAFYGDTQNAGGTWMGMTIDSDTSANGSYNTDSLTYAIYNAGGGSPYIKSIKVGDKWLYVNLKYAPLFTLTINSSENGSIKHDHTLGNEIPEDVEVTLKVSPNSDYELETLIVDGQNVTTQVSDGKYKFTMPDNDVTVSATFKALPHTHDWKYELVNASTIKAVCGNIDGRCPNTDGGSVTIAAPVGSPLEYNGAVQGANLFGSFATGVSNNDIVITYADNKSPINVGEYTASIEVDGATARVTYSIKQKDVTIKADDQTITYGESLTANAVTISGLIDGHTVTGVTLTPSITNVGTGTITPSAAVIMNGTEDVTANYNISYAVGTLTINAASMTGVSAVGYANAYDGKSHGITVTAPAGSTITYSTDDITYSAANPTYTDVCEITVFYKVEKENYETVPGSAVVKITPLDISTAEVTLGDALTYNGSEQTQTVAEVKVGDLTVDANAYAVTNNTATNAGTEYELTVTAKENSNFTGTVKKSFNVAQKGVSVSAGTYKVSKIYDGTTNAGTASGVLAISGILDADSGVTVTATPEAYSNANVGGQSTVNVSLTLSGDTNNNYVLESATLSVPCEITKKDIAIESADVSDKDYNGSDAAEVTAVTFKDVVTGETLAIGTDYTVTSAVFPDANADAENQTVTISVTLTDSVKANNYNLTNGTGFAVVNAAKINKIDYPNTITADTTVRANKAQNDLTFYLTDKLNGIDGAAIKSVAYGSNDKNLLAGTPTGSGKAVTYHVNNGTAVGDTGVIEVTVSSTNYNDFVVAVTVTTTDKDTLTITGVKMDAEMYTYGGAAVCYDNSALSVTGTTGVAFDNNDLEYVYSGTLADGSTYAESTVAPTKAGTYTLTVRVPADNLDYTGKQEISFTIGAKKITRPAQASAVVYNGAEQTYGVASTTEYTVTGGVQRNANETGYDVTIALTDKFNTVWDNGTTDDLTHKFIINKKAITITADDKEAYAGSRQPELTYTVDGLIEGDKLTTEPTLTTDANMNRVGTYTITASGADAGSNYTISYVNGTLTVEMFYFPIITPRYDVEIADDITGGDVSANKTQAYKGDTITITVAPDAEYQLIALTVTDSRGNAIALTKVSDTKYTFKMPGYDVVIDAAFAKIETPAPADPTVDCPRDWTCPMYGYIDLDRAAWYHNGVHFCIENNLMQGIGNNEFAPNGTTTRAMIVTILWRLEGSPVVNYAMDFEDVEADQWYTEAIRWAASEKIVEGYGNGKFGTNDAITREQFVTIMFRYAKYKGYDVSVGENTNILSYDDAFDVAEWAIPAMQWACGSGMIQGIADGNQMNLAPQGNATRAQAAAILQRFCENVAKEK